jgi:prepilin-type N-terminal cleavage/methylation domain-containing protein
MNTRGFSMIELLVVLAVVGILAALGYPYVSTYLRAASLRAGAQELATIVNGGRQLAITRNANVCVLVNNNQAMYRILVGAGNPCTAGAVYTGVETQDDGRIPLSNNIQITATTANVVFSPLGAATTAGTYTVHNPDGGANLGVVVSASGRVRIQ